MAERREAEKSDFQKWYETRPSRNAPIAINDLYDAHDLVNARRHAAEEAWHARQPEIDRLKRQLDDCADSFNAAMDGGRRG